MRGGIEHFKPRVYIWKIFVEVAIPHWGIEHFRPRVYIWKIFVKVSKVLDVAAVFISIKIVPQ